MTMGRPKSTLVLDSELREQLESLANSRSLPAGLVRRAKIILLSASGKNDREIAPQLETSRNTVGLWRRRFLAQGVSGLYDELRPGRPRPISDERVAQLVRKTLKSKPKAATHWSIRQIPTRREYRNQQCTASGRRLACSRIDKNISSFRTIHFL
jgi:putative transposase